MQEQEVIFRIKVVDDNTGKLASIEQQLAGLRKEREELNKKIKAGNDLSAEEAQKLAEVDAAQKALNQEKRTYNKEIENQIKLNKTNIDSLAGMRVRLSEMRAEYEKLDPATAKSKNLAKSIGELQTKVNDADFATKNFRGNVGNYMGAIDKLVDVTTMNFGEMRKELRELQNMSFAGKTKEEIEALNKRIGELKGGMDDLRAQQNNLDVEMGALIAGSLKAFSGAVETATATLGVFGVKGETIDKMNEKMVQLIAITQGLGAIEEVMAKRTLQTTAARLKSTAVIVAKTVATKAAAAATWIWNTALFANPVVAIVTGVVALTAAIFGLSRAFRSSTTEMSYTETVSKVFDDTIQSIRQSTYNLVLELKLLRGEISAFDKDRLSETQEFNKQMEDLQKKHQEELSKVTGEDRKKQQSAINPCCSCSLRNANFPASVSRYNSNS